MKKTRLAGLLLAGAMALNGIPYIAEPLGISVSAASKLAAPTDFSAAATDTTIKITWKEVAGADAYRVYKYNSSEKKYEVYRTVTAASCKVTELTSGTSYLFRVTALVKSGSKYTAQTMSSTVRIKTKLAAPANLKAATKSDTSIDLTWSAVKGADAYRVYYCDSVNGKPKVYKSAVLKTSCTVSGLKAGSVYWFSVAALVKKDSKYTAQTTTDVVIAATSGGKAVSSTGDLFRLPSFGISAAEAAKSLGMTDYITTTQETKGAKVTAYSGYVVINGQPATAILLESAKKQYFGGMLVYDGNVVTFDAAYNTLKKSLGKTVMNYELMGMKMYMWMDLAINVTMLIGADVDGNSMTIYYGLSYKYAPDEIKSAIKDGNGDISSLFA